jgi:hypothetical protein
MEQGTARHPGRVPCASVADDFEERLVSSTIRYANLGVGRIDQIQNRLFTTEANAISMVDPEIWTTR